MNKAANKASRLDNQLWRRRHIGSPLKDQGRQAEMASGQQSSATGTCRDAWRDRSTRRWCCLRRCKAWVLAGGYQPLEGIECHYQLSTITCIWKSNLRHTYYEWASFKFWTKILTEIKCLLYATADNSDADVPCWNLKSAIDALLQSGILDEVTSISVIASIDRNSFRSMKPSYIDINLASTQYYLSLANQRGISTMYLP